MVSMSGRGKISIPPNEDSGATYVEIEYARRKTLILSATSYLMRQAMVPLKKGDMIRFEGILSETDPGYYYVHVSHIEKVGKA